MKDDGALKRLTQAEYLDSKYSWRVYVRHPMSREQLGRRRTSRLVGSVFLVVIFFGIDSPDILLVRSPRYDVFYCQHGSQH